MKLSLDSLPRHLAREMSPVYLVSGDEPLLCGEAVDAVRARARAAGFTEREMHVVERGTDWDAVRAAAGTLSLFAARRIIELKLQGKPGVSGARALEAMIQSAGEDTILIIASPRLDRDAQSSAWVRAAEARGAWVTVWPVARERLPAWLEARCRRLGLKVEPRALELLAERTQGNLLAAQQELEKLKLLFGGKRLDVEHVLAGTADSARFNVGELSNALIAGQPARALRILQGLREEGVELPLVLWSVTKAMREGTSSARLVARAARADGMAKGRLPGNAWDEVALLAAEICGRTALPLLAT